MKTHFKLLALLLMLLMVLQSTVVSAFAFAPIEVETNIYQAAGQPTKYSSQYNSGQRDVIATTLNGTSADAYYSGSYEYDILSEKGANEIKSALSTLMKSTHKKTSSYDDCHYKVDRTDCENENGKISLIYTGYSATMSQWNGWNREHVWPQSLGGGNTSGGGADLHHVRPSDASVNSSRGNKKYGEVSGGNAVNGKNPATGYLGGYSSSSYFEPRDEVKGDVARICLYVWIRWGSAWGADSITEVFQSVDVLLAWMELDPVDTWELGRNEVVEDIQGNRNVFIDYPEYAWLIFGKEVPEDMTTPSGEASGGGHNWDSGSITKAATCTTAGAKTFTCTDSGCGKTKTETIPALGHSYNNGSITTEATCETAGVKMFTCSKCNATRTETISALGHSYGDWIIDVEATDTTTGSKHRICSICENTETRNIPVLGHEHVYTSVITKPTCTQKGYTTYTCECGETYVDSHTQTSAHSFTNGVCVNCGALESDAPKYSKEDFSSILTSLVSGRYKGEERFEKICEALKIYDSLSSADKESLSSKYNIFKTIVTEYNQEATVLNNTSSSFFNISVTLDASMIAFATYTVLKKKEF